MLRIIPNLAYWLFNLTVLDTWRKMISINPFSILAETVPPMVMQIFVITMVVLAAAGTLLDLIHKKSVKYFFENAK